VQLAPQGSGNFYLLEGKRGEDKMFQPIEGSGREKVFLFSDILIFFLKLQTSGRISHMPPSPHIEKSQEIILNTTLITNKCILYCIISMNQK